MSDSTRHLLTRICELFPTAVISGRSRADLAVRLSGVPVKHIIGNHGLEPWPGMRTFAREVGIMRSEITMRLRPHTQVDIEDKMYSLAIHYRDAVAKRETRAAILRASAKLRSKPRIMLGKMVVNLLPPGAPDKGIALEQLLIREGVGTAIYVGDDLTDEDAFAIGSKSSALTIRVGYERTSAARFFLRTQSDIDVLLARLVNLRRP